MKWNEETIANEIKKAMEKLKIDRMPTSMELRDSGMSGLSRAISLSGGFYYWKDRMKIERKETFRLWNDERIKNELIKSIGILILDRMPTAEELKSIGRTDLHNAVSKTKKYSGWAKELELTRKRSETTIGQEWERKMADFLRKYEYEVELMTTKHPYDLLVDGVVKVDVKVANPYLLRGSRVHTFGLGKKNPSCDIYILIALDEQGGRERTLVIPSHHVKQTMVNIGKNSKYNVYKDNWNVLYEYSKFFNDI